METPPPRPKPAHTPERASSMGGESTWSRIGAEEMQNAGAPGAGDNTGLWSLLTAASKFKAFEEDDESDESSSGPHTPPPELADGQSTAPTTSGDDAAERAAQAVRAEHESLGLADTQIPFNLSTTLTKLAANDYNIPSREAFGLDNVLEEDEDAEAAEPAQAETTSPEHGKENVIPHTPGRSAEAATENADVVGPAIVSLLEREFGVLAREGEKEEFFKETDCALLTETTILGTAQITNYRVTFHASLLSTEADSEPQNPNQVLKSGPFVYHPSGFRRKMRRWMELSHNMISAYANATDEARARPLRTFLLSSIETIAPYNRDEPRYVRFAMQKVTGKNSAFLEFDTEESAQDWHREIQAAVTAYRRRRSKAIFDAPADDGEREDNNGVRICVPLTRIETHTTHPFADFGFIVTFTLNEDLAIPVPSPSLLNPSAPSNTSATRPLRELNFLIFKSEKSPDVPRMMEAAKERLARDTKAGLPPLETDVLTVDFGPLTFGDEDFSTTASMNDCEKPAGWKKLPLEARMRIMFAIDEKEEVFTQRAWNRGRVCSSGYLLVTNSFLCFWSKSYTSIDFKLRFPMSQVNTAKALPTTMLGRAHVIGVEVRGHPLVQFGIQGHENRDKVIKKILEAKAASDAAHRPVLSPTSSGAIRPADVSSISSGLTTTSATMTSGSSSTLAESIAGSHHAHHGTQQIASPGATTPAGSAIPPYIMPISGDDLTEVLSSPPRNSDSTLFSKRAASMGPDELESMIPLRNGETILPPSEPLIGEDPEEIEAGVSAIKLDDTASVFTTGTGSSDASHSHSQPVPAPDHSAPLRRSASLSRTSSSASSQLTQKFAPLSHSIEFVRSHEMPLEAFGMIPRAINLPRGILRGMKSRHFVCLTIGSRGDVQPYIALCRGLIAEGHKATIVTHDEYRDWIEGFGVQHRAAGGDPGALMKLSVEHSMFSPQFFKESLGKFRGWLDDLLRDSWLQCHDADVLIESPSAMAGVHIAEALGIPYIRAFTMPWTRTTAYPHAFLSPPVELSGSLNYSTYVLFDNVFWTAMSGQVNRWRKNMLKIKKTDIETLAQTKIPFIYNFSPSVVPKPMDWSDIITISGYWFLDNPDLKWAPSPELLAFIKKAKDDGVPIVYIGFGSITVPHPHAMTRSIIKGVLKAGVRAIISKGWSDRMSKDTDEEPEFPPECFSLDKVPHDWLFPQMDAAMHHGGAGTTGASLRAGIPTIIKPWFGDQYFWASRVHKLGAGLRVDGLGSSELSSALKRATSDRVMKEKAAGVGERIRAENGVREAIRSIYTYLDRAKKDRTTL